jgi:COMPASS component SPP1
VLTLEEQALLATSAADRASLAAEIVLFQQMLSLLDRANERHRAAVASGSCERDACGYDARLDAASAPAQFAAFLASPDGQVLFPQGPESPPTGPLPPPVAAAEGEDGMCRRRKCKPHNGWYVIHSRHARFMAKELARESTQLLDREARVREAAAQRFLRRGQERFEVIHFASGETSA